MNQKGISSIVIILIIVGVLVIGGGIYWWQKLSTKETANWKVYQNQQYGLQFSYPTDGQLTEKQWGPRTDLGGLTYYTIDMTVPLITRYETWTGKSFNIVIHNRSEGKSCADTVSNLFQNGKQATINGRIYMSDNPSWNETSGMSSKSKQRNYATETATHCYIFTERISGPGPNSENYPRTPNSNTPSDLNEFFNVELKVLEDVMHTVKISESTPAPAPSSENVSKPKAIMQYIKSGKGTEPPPSAPKIYILSPVKGDIWEIGSKQVIKWSYVGSFQSLTYKWTGIIFTCGSANYYYEIIKSFNGGVTEIPTSFEWTVPARALDRSDCMIRVEYNTSNSSDFGGMYSPEVGYWSSSEQFTIKTPGTGQPKITIISPAKGETLKVGQPYVIKWGRERLSRGVRIYLHKGGENIGYIDKGPFAPIFDMQFVWNIGELVRFGQSLWQKSDFVPDNNYQIRIVTEDWAIGAPPAQAEALSDPFTIVQ